MVSNSYIHASFNSHSTAYSGWVIIHVQWGGGHLAWFTPNPIIIRLSIGIALEGGGGHACVTGTSPLPPPPMQRLSWLCTWYNWWWQSRLERYPFFGEKSTPALRVYLSQCCEIRTPLQSGHFMWAQWCPKYSQSLRFHCTLIVLCVTYNCE